MVAIEVSIDLIICRILFDGGDGVESTIEYVES